MHLVAAAAGGVLKMISTRYAGTPVRYHSRSCMYTNIQWAKYLEPRQEQRRGPGPECTNKGQSGIPLQFTSFAAAVVLCIRSWTPHFWSYSVGIAKQQRSRFDVMGTSDESFPR